MRRTLLVLVGALVLISPSAATDLRESKGLVTATSSTSVSVRTERATVVCRLGERSPSLDGYSAGDPVVVVCARNRDRWVLVRIRHVTPVRLTTQELGGAVFAISPSSLSVRDGDRSLTCAVDAQSPSLSSVVVGDRVRIRCTNSLLVSLERSVAPVEGNGVITSLTRESIAVHGERDLTCALGPKSPPVGEIRVGDRVRVVCAGGTLLVLQRVDAPSPTPQPTPARAPPAPAAVYAAGSITALDARSISIHGERDVTCTVGERSPRLGDFHVGDRVRISCVGSDLASIARL